MNKTVLVTGAAKGIGKACVLAFAKLGYNVVINYLNSETEALKLKEEVENSFNASTLVIKADVTDEEQVSKMISMVVNEFEKLDVLINNAAYASDNYYFDKTKEEFLKVLEVNVVGPFLVTKHAIKHMNNGVVINVSSTDADDTFNEISMDYCASKAALNSLAKTFSLASVQNKFITVMLPWIKTEPTLKMFPEYLDGELKRTGQKRLLEPAEVAKAFIDFLNDETIKSGSVLRLDVQ